MKILFVRHGESIDDIEDRYGGWADFDLTEKGKTQLIESANKISELGEKFDIILSSPLKRAIQAAKIISDQINVSVEIFEYLKERNLNGILTGMTRGEALVKYPEQVEQHKKYQYVDGSERTEDMNTRVKNANVLLKNMGFESIIAVTHGLFIRTFFKEIMNIDVLKVGDGGFVLIEFNDQTFKVIKSEGVDFKE